MRQLFGDAVADGTLMLLDGGVLGNVPPSTLVDCTGPLPRIVREGAILTLFAEPRIFSDRQVLPREWHCGQPG